MNTSIGTWVLAGALAASLFWNAKTLLATDAPADPAPAGPICAPAIDLDRLQLNGEQRAALEHWSENACAPACAVGSEADAKWEELSTALRDPKLGAERLRSMATEVSDARARSLEAYVASILEVRRVLSPQQLDELLNCCALDNTSP